MGLGTKGRCPLFAVVMLGCVVAVISAAGCGSSDAGGGGASGDNNGTGITVPVPDRINKHLVADGRLSAQAVVDGARVVDLTVDPVGHRVSGSIPDVAEGGHTLEVIYYIDNGGTRVEVARATTSVQVVAGGTGTATFEGDDLVYTDTDRDGFSNLAELEIGTDYTDRTSLPKAEDLRSSANYLLADGVGGTAEIGPTVASGRATSTNYTLY